jgi:hypothetical protein
MSSTTRSNLAVTMRALVLLEERVGAPHCARAESGDCCACLRAWQAGCRASQRFRRQYGGRRAIVVCVEWMLSRYRWARSGQAAASGGRYVTSPCSEGARDLSGALLVSLYACVARRTGRRTECWSCGRKRRALHCEPGEGRALVAVAARGTNAKDISGTLQGLRGRNMDARLKLWLEATAGMQGRCLLRAMMGGEQVAARSWTDGEQQVSGCNVWLRRRHSVA